MVNLIVNGKVLIEWIENFISQPNFKLRLKMSAKNYEIIEIILYTI